MTSADFNRDGRLDVAITRSGGIVVLTGDGSGFAQSAVIANNFFGLNSIAADGFNGDGNLDVATADATGVSVALGNGAGGFNTPIRTATPTALAITVGDFNRDGFVDVAISTSGDDVNVLTANGMGGFSNRISYPLRSSNSTSSSSQGIVSSDFNGDGWLDLTTINAFTNTALVLLNDGTGKYGLVASYGVGGNPGFIASGDYNGDNRRDLVVANSGSNSITLLRGTGTGAFKGVSTLSVGLTPLSIVARDFNHDGRTDLAVNNANQNSISVLLSTETGGFRTVANFSVSDPRGLDAADLNGDGNLDLVTANGIIFDTVSVLLGDGRGGFGTAITSGANNPTSVAVGDFNRDGKPDVFVGNNQTYTTSLLYGDGFGRLNVANEVASDGTPSFVQTSDFNKDGVADVAVARRGSVSIVLGDGRGGMLSIDAGTFAGLRSFTIADVNSDSNFDLIVTGSYEPPQVKRGTIFVLMGDGGGNFTNRQEYTLDSRPQFATVGDINGDGKADVAISNTDSTSVLLGDGSGSFGGSTEFKAGSGAIAAGDYNADGRLDLAVVNSNANNISLLYNACEALSAVPGNLIASDSIALENDRNARYAAFNLSLPFVSGRALTVTYETTNGTAVSGADYIAASGTLVFSPGTITQTVLVPIIGDDVVEPTEYFNINFRLIDAPTSVTAQARGMIINAARKGRAFLRRRVR